MIWLQFVLCVVVILFLGRKVARYGDTIATKTGLGGLWIGLVLISVTTSLPELFTGVSAITILDAPDLTIGNLLGANAFNLLNLALLDTVFRGQSLLSIVGRGQRLTCWFSLILVSLVALGIFLQPVWNFTLGWISWITPVIIIPYFFSIRQIFLAERRTTQHGITEEKYQDASLGRTFLYFAIAALLIIGAGIWLATIGDQIAESTGLGKSFIGSLLIGLVTTLPEITVSYSALRLGAADLAVSNMIGSNMFNMFLICLDDIIYFKGPIMGTISPNNLVTATTVIVMTFITLAALYYKPRRIWRLNWFSLPVLLVFIAGTFISFIMNK